MNESKGYTIKNQAALHYVTFTVVGWVDVFTRKSYRDIIMDSLTYCQKEQGLNIYAYVIMSNHVHLIVRAENGNLSKVIHNCRKFTATKILEAIQKGPESRMEWMIKVFAYFAKFKSNYKHFQFWKKDFHPIELSSNAWIRQKLDYIHLNPVKAGIVAHPEHYLYSSASNYQNGTGILNITVMDKIWNDVGLIA